jgi:hypothetical protein
VVPGNYAEYKLEAQSGYMMTMAAAKRSTWQGSYTPNPRANSRKQLIRITN